MNKYRNRIKEEKINRKEHKEIAKDAKWQFRQELFADFANSLSDLCG